MAAPPSVQLGILGPLLVEVDGSRVPIGAPRQRALVIRLLVAEGVIVSAERLIDDLWAGEPPPSAVNTLQSYLSVLRRAFGPAGRQLLVRDGPGYQLAAPAGAVDARRFEALLGRARELRPVDPPAALAALDAALGAWRGPALADVADEGWARPVAAKLEEQRAAAVEDRVDVLLALGRHAEAVGTIERALADDPLRERLAGQLMLALYRSGRQADALDVFQRTRRRLADELGLEPTPELARLEAAILTHDPSVATPTDQPASVPTARSPVEESTRRVVASPDPAPGAAPLPLPPGILTVLRHGPLVGRQVELDELEVAWARARAGERFLLLVAGEPGIGKTRLAAGFAEAAHEAGAIVLWGRVEAEPLAPYQPIAEALRTALRSIDDASLAAVAGGRPVLVHLLPELADRGVAAPVTADPHGERYALFEAIAGLLEAASERAPVLLVLDDLQWVDAPTLRLIGHLLRPERSGRLLVVGTLRWPVQPPNEALADLIADLRRDRMVERLSLDGLSAEAVLALVGARAVALGPTMSTRIHAATGGNPFFVEELASHLCEVGSGDDVLAAGLPESIRDVLGRRIDRLGEQVVRVLSLAAVAGSEADLGVVAEALAVDDDVVVTAADEATAAGLARQVSPTRLGFPHALVRQVLLDRLGPARRARSHLRLADILQRRGMPHSALAAHLVAAGDAVPAERRARAVLGAGRVSFAGLAFEDALAQAQLAAQLLDGAEPGLSARAALLEASARWGLGDGPGAMVAFERAGQAAARAGDAVVLARAAEGRALAVSGLGFQFGLTDDGLVAQVEAALAAQPADARSDRSRLLSTLVGARLNVDPPARLDTWADEALELARAASDDMAAAAALLAVRQSRWQPDRLDERLAAVPEALELARRCGNLTLELNALVVGAADCYEAGRAAELVGTLDVLRNRCETVPLPVYRGYLLFFEASLALVRGEYDHAAELAEQAMAVAGALLGTGGPLAQFGQQLQAAADQGHLGAFVSPLRDLAVAFPDLAVLHAGLASALVEAGEADEARQLVRALVTAEGVHLPLDSFFLLGGVFLGRAAAALGEVEVSERLLATYRLYADRMAIGGLGGVCAGPLAAVLADLALTVGRPGEADTHIARAWSLAEAFGAEPVLHRLSVRRS